MTRLAGISVVVILLYVNFAQSLDIEKACKEYTEQKKSALSQMSTSLKEANLSGQCIAWRKINQGEGVNILKACSEFIEQKKNLLGNMSTSLPEANQAGICIGAIYASCNRRLHDYMSAAINIVNYGSERLTSKSIENVAGCNGRYKH